MPINDPALIAICLAELARIGWSSAAVALALKDLAQHAADDPEMRNVILPDAGYIDDHYSEIKSPASLKNALESEPEHVLSGRFPRNAIEGDYLRPVHVHVQW
jgi:hypothetical protein